MRAKSLWLLVVSLAILGCILAENAFRGGRVVGASEQRGENVEQRPICPWDLSASLCKLLGIDPEGKLPHPKAASPT